MVFVDTSAYIALARLDDERHNEAVIILNALQRQRVRLCTTNFVVAETHAMMLRYLGRAVAWRFVQELDKSRVTTTVRVELADEAGARGDFRAPCRQGLFSDGCAFVFRDEASRASRMPSLSISILRSSVS